MYSNHLALVLQRCREAKGMREAKGSNRRKKQRNNERNHISAQDQEENQQPLFFDDGFSEYTSLNKAKDELKSWLGNIHQNHNGFQQANHPM
jgi:hypothetical protein